MAVAMVVTAGLCDIGSSASAESKVSKGAASKTEYYLALGDSLVTGGGTTSVADRYVNLIAAHEASRYPNLQLVNLGCGGATTASMMNGPGCSYTTGTQLGDAVAFLESHHGQVAFLTIDIGADDVQTCQTSTGLNAACAQAGENQITADLPRDLSALKAAYRGLAHLRHGLLRPVPRLLVGWVEWSERGAVDHYRGRRAERALGQIYQSAGVSMADPA